MPKVHVIDKFLNKVMEYESEAEVEFLIKITEYNKHEFNEERQNEPMITVTLEDGTVLNYYDNGIEAFIDCKRKVYAPVYDVETCEREGYSMYEEEDIIGFVNREYDYADYMN